MAFLAGKHDKRAPASLAGKLRFQILLVLGPGTPSVFFCKNVILLVKRSRLIYAGVY